MESNSNQIFFSIGKLDMSGDHTNFTSCFNISQSPLISMNNESTLQTIPFFKIPLDTQIKSDQTIDSFPLTTFSDNTTKEPNISLSLKKILS